MKTRLSFIVLAVILSLCASEPLDAFRDVVIQNVDRAVDLTSQLCRVETLVEVKNERDTSVNEFFFAIPSELADTLRYFVVRDKYNDAQTYEYKIVDNLKIKSEYNATLYRIALDPPLRSGQSKTLRVSELYWGRMSPLPKKITILEDQKMVFDDSSYYFSPYTVLSQSTFYKLAGFPISYSDSEGKVRGQNLEYKFTSTVGAFERKANRIHFENNIPFVVFKEVTKTIEVSHWGNIYIEESYKLAHEGAEFIGEFSRIDFNNFNRNAGKAALRGLNAKYPLYTWGMHYRDEVGNISTSRAYRDHEKVNLSIQPRFAILGGWSSNWVISYNLPTSYYLFNKGNDKSSFVLKQDFGFPFENILAEKYTLKIILPEGATDSHLNLPFGVDNQYQTKTFSYLDVEGRPTLVVEKKNVLDYHKQEFDVTYKFDTSNIFIEGGLLFGFFLVVFAIAIIIGRIDFAFKHKTA